MKKGLCKIIAVIISCSVILCDNSIVSFASDIVPELDETVEEDMNDDSISEDEIVEEDCSETVVENGEESFPKIEDIDCSSDENAESAEEVAFAEESTEEESEEIICTEEIIEETIPENEEFSEDQFVTDDETTEEELIWDEPTYEGTDESDVNDFIYDDADEQIVEEPAVEEVGEDEETASTEVEEVLGVAADIASGSVKELNWRITEKGHLKIWGTGDYFASYPLSGESAPWGNYSEQIITAEADVSDIHFADGFFAGLYNLTTVDLRKFDSSNLVRASVMFSNCSRLKKVTFGKSKWPNLERTMQMFYHCSSLESIDMSSFGQANLIYANNMFEGCTNLKYINMGSFVIDRDTDVDDMLLGCNKLSKFITPKRCDVELSLPQNVIMWDSNKNTYITAPNRKKTLRRCYEIVYYSEKWTEDQQPRVKYYPENTTITLKKTAKLKGYRFDGWHVYGGDPNVKKKTARNENITVEASWIPNKYTITFNGCGGTYINSDGKRSSKYKKNMTYGYYDIFPDVFSRPGYYLDGWSTKPNGKGKYFYTDTFIINLTSKNKGNVNFYAIWKPSAYVVSFNINTKGNMSGSGSMTAIGVDYGKKVKLPANGFSCKGYTFKGWSLTPDGPVKFKNKASVKNLITWGEVKLYAVWSVNTYSVKFSANGAIKGTPPQTVKNLKYGVNRITLPQNPFTPKANYRFAGWNLKSGGNSETRYLSGRTVDLVATKNNQTITLYAEWDYDLNVCTDGTNVKTLSGVSYNQSITTKTLESRFPELAKNGYYIAGWNTSQSAANKGKIKYKSSVKNVAGKVIYPVYKKSK